MIMKILLKIKEVVRGQNFLLGQLAGGWRKNKKIPGYQSIGKTSKVEKDFNIHKQVYYTE
jgi:hypothetical protein